MDGPRPATAIQHLLAVISEGRRLVQVLPVFAGRDAIGGHVQRLDQAIRGRGVETAILAPDIHDEVRHLARPWAVDEIRHDDVVLYHLSVGSSVAEELAALDVRLVLDHHNITPASMFEPWEPHVGAVIRQGRAQLEVLAPRAVLGLADSSYNESELIAAGCTTTQVAPILIDTTEFDRDLDPDLVDQLTSPHPTWLFVGRIAPNKAQHDIIAALAAYHRHYDPTAQLRLVGGTSSPRYEAALRAYATDLGIAHAVDITGPVTPAELTAHYATADVFCCLSDHEGFCVPLLEAMHHHLPIVAHATTAIPETLGNAGLLLDDKQPTTVATAAHRALTDTHLQHTLTTNADHRLRHFHLDNTRTTILDTLTPLLR
jgi:L-malate glycosyltransferase